MARKLFEFRATRARAGGLAVGIEYVVWDDEGATVLADISTSSGGSSIAGSTVTTADIAGLGPSACRFWGPTDDQDTLWVTCPSDPTLGVQRVEASTDARLDALEAGGGGSVAAHSADTTAIHGIADTATLARKPVSGDAILYVSGSGSDANDGLSWGSAKRNLQAVYDALPSTHPTSGGIIHVAPAAYDVGAFGLVMQRTKPAVFLGAGRPHRLVASGAGSYANTAPVIYTTSNPEALVNMNEPWGVVNNGYGFEFHNLVFSLTHADTRRGIRAPCMNFCVVDNCQFYAATGTDVDVIGIQATVDPTRGDDVSWWRITNNVTSNIALALLGQDTGTLQNCNQHVIKDNVCFGRGTGVTTARPGLRIRGSHRSVARDNNWESFAIGEQWEDCWGCHSEGASGEATPTIIDLKDVVGSYFNPIGISAPDLDPAAVAVRGDSGTRNNIIVVANAFHGSGRLYQDVAGGVDLANPLNTIVTSNTITQDAFDTKVPYIPDLVLWLAGDRIPGRVDAGAVATWPDQSGNSRDAVQGTGANQPTARLVDGRWWVRFDGSSDYLEIPYAADLNPAAFTIVAVLKASGGGASFRAAVTSRDTGPERGYILYADAGDDWSLWQGVATPAWTAQAGGNVTVGAAAVVTASYDGTTMSVREDGVSVASAAAPAAFVQNTARPLRIGAGSTETTPSLYWNGDIAEVRIYSRGLSIGERKHIEQYLGRKYAIPVTV